VFIPSVTPLLLLTARLGHRWPQVMPGQQQSLQPPLGQNHEVVGSGSPRLVADAVGGIDPQIEHITNREAVRVLVSALPQREQDVLRMRFFESMTQSQIAERIGVSQMQVSRILANTLRRLRDQLE